MGNINESIKPNMTTVTSGYISWLEERIIETEKQKNDSDELNIRISKGGKLTAYKEVINSFISQKDIPSLLNKYKCALMPTKYDAQGVMVCEMATFGMPVITSDFEVCVEMLNDFNNVAFLSEAEFSSLKYEQINISEDRIKNQKFSSKKLVEEELAFFDKL